jgi:hypothetical protein
MKGETLLRAAAVAGAVVLLAAPYAEEIKSAAARGGRFLGARRGLLARLAAATLIVAAAWGRIPIPLTLPASPTITVATPTAEMRNLVAPVVRALGQLSGTERALWASVWSKAAIVVENPGTGETQILHDTPALRLFTVVALDVAWRRLGGHAPGSVAGLRQAVENSLSAAIGTEAVPVTTEVRGRYGEIARAIAWAAIGSGE